MRTATKQEAINGNSNDTVITPLRLKQVLSNADINPGGGGGSSDAPVYAAGTGISIINNVISNTITKTSQLTNDSNFITEADLPDININDPVPINSIFAYEGDTVPDGFIEYTGEIGGEGGGTSFEETDPTVPDYVKTITPEDIEKWNTGVDLTDYAKKNEIPKNLSQLNNDSGFINAIPEDVLRKDTDVRVSNVVSKNLFNKNVNPVASYSVSFSSLNNGVRITTNNEANNSYAVYKLSNALLGKTITLTSNIVTSSSNQGIARIFFGNSSNYAVTNVANLETSGSVRANIPSSFPSDTDGIYLLLYGNRNGSGFNVGAYVDYTNIQIEEGSQVSEYTPYLNLEEAMKENNIYSTSEVKIGTWIDGKPLYRKVLTGTTNSTAGDLVIDLSSLNINYISKFDGTVGTNFDYRPINFCLGENYISTRYAYGKLYLACTGAYTNLPFTMVLEYTKTTD